MYFDFFGKEYVLPINHNESVNIDLPNLKSNTKKYTNNKNKLLHLLDLENVIDVNMIHYMKSGEPIDFEECETNAHSFLNMKYYKKTDVNTVIPILKHVDRCRRYTKILKDIIEKSGDYVNMSYNDEVIKNFVSMPFTITAQTDRMGLRLEGEPLLSNISHDILSEGILPGSIQVPSNGKPIVLMRDNKRIRKDLKK